MRQTQKWLRNAVMGAVAFGAIGIVNTSSAMAASDVTLVQHHQRAYHEHEWRHMHPDWNGRLYWHNHHYYFDSGYTSPAIVDDDWATIGGGVTLNSDPYVYFSGSYGSLYPTASLDIDLGSSDRTRHARALYFEHPSFVRDGVRYDRTTVTRNGTHYYRFVRHH